MSNVFYVYEHWRPDLDVPFYVGKGKARENIKKGWELRRQRALLGEYN